MESKFVDRLRKNYLYQHIKSPTRYREKQKANVLDLVITDGDFIASIDIQSPLGKSDHAVMEMVCILEYEQHKDTKNIIGPREIMMKCAHSYEAMRKISKISLM